MALLDTHFTDAIELDIFRLLCGDLIGEGASREVFIYQPDYDYVVKIEAQSYSFRNIIEWQVWQDADELGIEISNWLAPCKTISPSGIALIQRRTKPAKTYPKKIPSWMTDTKRSNFGMLGRRFVAHDYGHNVICNGGMTKRLSKAKWWDET